MRPTGYHWLEQESELYGALSDTMDAARGSHEAHTQPSSSGDTPLWRGIVLHGGHHLRLGDTSRRMQGDWPGGWPAQGHGHEALSLSLRESACKRQISTSGIKGLYRVDDRDLPSIT